MKEIELLPCNVCGLQGEYKNWNNDHWVDCDCKNMHSSKESAIELWNKKQSINTRHEPVKECTLCGGTGVLTPIQKCLCNPDAQAFSSKFKTNSPEPVKSVDVEGLVEWSYELWHTKCIADNNVLQMYLREVVNHILQKSRPDGRVDEAIDEALGYIDDTIDIVNGGIHMYKKYKSEAIVKLLTKIKSKLTKGGD